MNNFFRAVKRTFQFRLQIVLVLFCALMVGILWGGNIGAVVGPMTKICLEKDSTFTTWIDQIIGDNRKKIVQTEQELQSLQSSSASTVRQITGKSKTLQRQQRAESWLLWARTLCERYTPNDSFRTILFLMKLILLGTVVKIVFLISHSVLSAWIAQKAAMEIRDEFFRKTLDFETQYFSREGVADMMSRFTNDMTMLTGGLNLLYGKVIREPLKMIVCLGMAAWISWQLLVVTLVLVPLAAVCIRWLAKSIKRVVRRSMEEMSNMYARLEETFRAIRVVKAFTRENFERARFHRTNRAYCQRAIKIAKYEALANPLTELFGILMICVAIAVGAYLVIGEHTTLLGITIFSEPMDLVMLVTFFALLAGAADPARKLSDIFTQFQSAAAAADRIYALIDRESSVPAVRDPRPLPKHHRSIRFDEVRFGYDSERPILKDVSLEIPFGECIAVMGPNGCGKSTLLNLLPRFFDPDSGRILIDDQAIDEVRARDLRRQIGLVTQEPILFNDTVLNNIRYGYAGSTRNEAIEAAQKAFAHDFIVGELSDGYETIVGPGGGRLSGGQRQRIALARAMLRNPTILLLDEATSQIDIQSEKMIHEALQEFRRGRTTIMVTHRLAALELADRIIVMEDGAVSAVGTHEELLDRSTFYAGLH